MASVQFTVAHGTTFTVSAEDAERVSQHKWVLWGQYLYCNELSLCLHQFIMGHRPDDVPDNYVIDHANRDKLDARRSNLRWVSRSFNLWNFKRITEGPYRGVQRDSNNNKWQARFRGGFMGAFHDAREAFVAYATAAIREWGSWASQSDLLVGPGLLTQKEARALQQLAQAEPKVKRVLPKGVYPQHQKYIAVFKKQTLGRFATIAEAECKYIQTVQRFHEEEWAKHWQKPVPLNEHGQAEIQLSGQLGNGMVTVVPPCLYHVLSFTSSWSLNGKYVKGRWRGEAVQLHVIVYQLLHPTYIPSPDRTIDHINHDGLAAGAKTTKMHPGHRGANHPVKRLEDGVVEITSMNHGFAVDNAALPDSVEETHVSLFDGSNCGIAVKGKRAFGVQYHPEASPGPMDSFYLFERFVEMLG